MIQRAVCTLALLAIGLVASSCGRSIDLVAALEVTDVTSGFYDNGLKDGWRHLLPSVSFKLKNVTPDEVDGVQVTVQFWKTGDLSEFESKLLGAMDLAGGTETETKLIRTDVGYRLENDQTEELFNHSQFKDFTVRFFARRSGQLVQIGEHTVERRILAQGTAGRP